MQPAKISTCLWFDRDGEAAAEFYVSLIPDSRIVHVTRFRRDMGVPNDLPDGFPLAVDFVLGDPARGGASFQALNGGPLFPQSEAASIVVHCDDQAEVDRLWAALTANGGQESQCGWLKDRFGVSWQIVPRRFDEMLRSDDTAAVARMTQAMLQMQKLDIARLEAAFRGA